MSFKKPTVEPDEYIETGDQKVHVSRRQVALKAANHLGTPSLLWLLITRHKVGLLAMGNIVLVLNWILPEWPSMVMGLVGR